MLLLLVQTKEVAETSARSKFDGAAASLVMGGTLCI